MHKNKRCRTAPLRPKIVQVWLRKVRIPIRGQIVDIWEALNKKFARFFTFSLRTCAQFVHALEFALFLGTKAPFLVGKVLFESTHAAHLMIPMFLSLFIISCKKVQIPSRGQIVDKCEAENGNFSRFFPFSVRTCPQFIHELEFALFSVTHAPFLVVEVPSESTCCCGS